MDFGETTIKSSPVEEPIDFKKESETVNTDGIYYKINQARQFQQKGLIKDAEHIIEEAMSEENTNNSLELKELNAWLNYYRALQKEPRDAYIFFKLAFENFSEIFSETYGEDSQNRILPVLIEIMSRTKKMYNLLDINTLKQLPKKFLELKEELFNLIKLSRLNEKFFLDQLKVYVEKGYSIDAQDEFDDTLLHHAIALSKNNIAQTLLSFNARFDLKNIDGKMAVDIALSQNNSQMLSIFFEKEKAYLDATTNNNYVLLHKLIFSSHIGNYFKLISQWVNKLDSSIRQRWVLAKMDGKALYQVMLEVNQEKLKPDLFELFILKDSSMDINLLATWIREKQVKLCQFALSQWLKASINLNQLLLDKKTVLALALQSGDSQLTELLLKHHADVNQQFFYQITTKTAAVKMMRITPINFVISQRNLPLLKILLKHKPDLSVWDGQKQTAFHIAAMIGSLEIFKAVYNGISEDKKLQCFLNKDENGETPLHLVIKYQHFECLQWIMEILQDDKYQTKKETIDAILNQANCKGETPLKIAVQTYNIPAVSTFMHLRFNSFWNNNQAHSALQLASIDPAMPRTIVTELYQAKISHCITLVKAQMEVLLNNDAVHKKFLPQWIKRLEQVILEDQYTQYKKALMTTSMIPLQKMAERLAIAITNAIRATYKAAEDKKLLETNIRDNSYHVWDQLLRKAIDNSINLVTEQVSARQNISKTNCSFMPSVFKSDKHRAFTRALDDALRNYFYVSRALYEGQVLMNDEKFNAFKSIFNIATSATITTIEMPGNISHIGVAATFVGAALELITVLKNAKYQCEAGRFVQSFGLCQPDAIDKREKGIEIDHDKLEAVIGALYQRYRDQIQECTLSKESETFIRLAKTDGICVLANVMADRIFQHIIKKESIAEKDDRTVTKYVSDWFTNIGAEKDIYRELSLISLPERCIMAVLYESVNEDRNREIRTDKWLKNGCVTEDTWQAGGILVKTGLKLQDNPNVLYIRQGNVEEESMHEKYGYCYVSASMIALKEIEKRGFVPASQINLDIFSGQINEDDYQTLQQCCLV